MSVERDPSEQLPPHRFDDADERLHAPPGPAPARWQENLFFVAWDLDGGHGFLIHTKRWPAKGDHEAHLVVYVAGEPVSAILHRPTRTAQLVEQEIPELSAVPERPWSKWRIQARFDGASGEGPHGFLAFAPRGPTSGAIDVVLESDLPPADFNQALAQLSDSLAQDGKGSWTSAQAHYEQGGRWRGTLTVGNRTITTQGLFVRDHSWGERVESNFDSGVFWTASSLDGGRVFCNAIGFPRPEGTIGTGILVSERGAFVTRDVSAVFSPRPGLRCYDQSTVHYGFREPLTLQGRTRVHVPKYLPGSGARRYDNNAISYVTMAGITGMGCLEWAGVLEASQAADLDRAMEEATH